jgi:ribosomal protein L25 (general stress protein Ctc)
MREAVALVRRVTDRVLRDRSVGHIIDLCIDGGEEGQATVLLSLVQSDFVRREIAGKHPQLAR